MDPNGQALQPGQSVIYDVPVHSRTEVLEYLHEPDGPRLVLVQQLPEGNVGGRRVKLPILVVTTEATEIYSKDLVRKVKKRPVPIWSATQTECSRVERTRSGKYVALTTIDDETIALLVADDASAWRVLTALEALTNDSPESIPQPGVDYGWTNAVILASYGYGFSEGESLAFAMDTEVFWLRSYSSTHVERIRLDSILAAEVGGPGEVQSGGGFIGGGFGVDGFLIGAAGAAVLNKLTTRSSVQTVLRITTKQGELTLFTDQVTPDALDHWLAPVRHTIATGGDKPVPPVAASSVADELSKLAGLKDEGLLTEEEFAAAKARLLE